jgi:uncharacterized membrane protein
MTFVWIMLGMCAFCAMVGVITAIRNEKHHHYQPGQAIPGHVMKDSLKHDHV